jgi:alkanesulfonate monooxygenase SsuD/methylene tetrahydromethanopterin reductase-like flavin-dependent oxidoreductase (luciferase family)
MRIGVMIGPERGRYDTKVDRLRRDGRWAEQAGFSTVWIPQIPDEFDALTAAAVIGAETERIEIGTAVVPVQPRPPDRAGAAGAVGAGRVRRASPPGPGCVAPLDH